jgi:xanthine dehydrogenase YagR molybdenum-binding subunit
MAASAQDTATIGAPTARIDARLKVTGEARYGSDIALGNPAYAVLVTSAAAAGRIDKIDERDSRAVPGVLDILTHRNIGGAVRPVELLSEGGYVGSTIMPLDNARIWHSGQIVAVILAETFEAASEAAQRLKIAYVEGTPAAGFDADGVTIVDAKDASPGHHDP